jgi:hypothetical protein
MNPAYRPMLATLVDEPFDDKKWMFETKWDGFRLVAAKRDNALRLWSRNGIDVTKRYQVLLPALQNRRAQCLGSGLRPLSSPDLSRNVSPTHSTLPAVTQPASMPPFAARGSRSALHIVARRPGGAQWTPADSPPCASGAPLGRVRLRRWAMPSRSRHRKRSSSRKLSKSAPARKI